MPTTIKITISGTISDILALQGKMSDRKVSFENLVSIDCREKPVITFIFEKIDMEEEMTRMGVTTLRMGAVVDKCNVCGFEAEITPCMSCAIDNIIFRKREAAVYEGDDESEEDTPITGED